nr:potassium channel family protein [Pseudenhygromyxa sp. WMMC2535]
MFALMALEASDPSVRAAATRLYFWFCVPFLLEWCVGLANADRKWAYVKEPSNVADLLSSVPFGAVFQGFRLVRLLRLMRLLRIVVRTQRFQGRAAKLIRALGLVSSLVLAAAIAFRTVEPQSTTGLEQALWWAIVTLSTVGYGDVMPTTPAGHVVAAAVIFAGLGAFGYVAGVMTAVLDEPQPPAPTREDFDRLRAELVEIKGLLASMQPAELSSQVQHGRQ